MKNKIIGIALIMVCQASIASWGELADEPWVQEQRKRRNEQDEELLIKMIRRIITGPNECRIDSRVAPYFKMVEIAIRAKPEDLGYENSERSPKYFNVQNDRFAIFTNGECLYKLRHIAKMDELYLHPEGFARASAFSEDSFVRPSTISSVVSSHDDIDWQQSEKFLHIIHVLRPGIIQRRRGAAGLVMAYHDEKIAETSTISGDPVEGGELDSSE